MATIMRFLAFRFRNPQLICLVQRHLLLSNKPDGAMHLVEILAPNTQMIV
jgi:hypothetical protein